MTSWTHERRSGCKVNFLLNILGKRADGFHELETIMHPVAIFDELRFERAAKGIELACSEPALPVDRGNLVFRAAEAFLARAAISEGVRIHLEKKIPMEAGLGGGSGNAAAALLGLNELFGKPLDMVVLSEIAASLGSDVPFFLQNEPALATGRGEKIQPLGPFATLAGGAFFLVHPGFGISTAWAYQQLARFPSALNGTRGRANQLVAALRAGRLKEAGSHFYNSLEAPALKKYPLLALFQDFMRENGAVAALMSGSGSTTFAITQDRSAAEKLSEKFKTEFGASYWMTVVETMPDVAA